MSDWTDVELVVYDETTGGLPRWFERAVQAIPRAGRTRSGPPTVHGAVMTTHGTPRVLLYRSGDRVSTVVHSLERGLATRYHAEWASPA